MVAFQTNGDLVQLPATELQSFGHFLKLKLNAETITSVGSEERMRAFVEGTMIIASEREGDIVELQCTDEDLLARIADKWKTRGGF